MASAIPKSAFDVARSARGVDPCDRVLGFRMAQVEAFVRSRTAVGEPFPSLGELKRELGFYDKAGALRSLRRLKQRGGA